MREFGPQYEAMAQMEKEDLFTGFLPQAESPFRLLDVGAGTLPNAPLYTQVQPRPAIQHLLGTVVKHSMHVPHG